MIHTMNYETVTINIAENEGTIAKPEHIFNIFNHDPTVDWDTEQMWVIGLNVKNDVHLKHLVAKGSYNHLMCTPADVFIPVLKLNLRHIIIVHNHPSGDPEPSPEDHAITFQLLIALKSIGVTLHEHMAIGDSKYYSMADHGVMASLNDK